MVKGMHDIITLTGNRRGKSPVRFDGLAHMSIGRWMSERMGSSSGIRYSEDSWDVSKHVYKKPGQKPRITALQYEPKIECIQDIIEDYNNKGSLGVILEFRGFSFLERAFTKSRNNYKGVYGQDAYFHQTKVGYRNKEAFFILSTIENILEVEVVPQKNGINRLFYDEMYIPELVKVYDPSSMEVLRRNDIVTISYKKYNTSE